MDDIVKLHWTADPVRANMTRTITAVSLQARSPRGFGYLPSAAAQKRWFFVIRVTHPLLGWWVPGD
jgi:hypothetical protein